MRFRFPIVLSLAFAVAASVCVVPARAAGRPSVAAAVDGRESGTGRALVTLIGKQLTKVKAVTVLDAAQMDVGTADVVSKTAAAVVVRLPEGIPAGEYTLALTTETGQPIAVAVRTGGPALLTDGSNAMTGALRSMSDDGVLFGGTAALGADPPAGPGVRMFWYPKKYAFRAGLARADEWDPANIGEASIGIGDECRSIGYGSVAMGSTAYAADAGSVAIGVEVAANRSGAVAMGIACTAESHSVALGGFAQATGGGATAIGSAVQATGAYAACFGRQTVAQSYGSLVFGVGNVIAGTPTSPVPTDPLFVCGNGTSAARSNALTLLKNGDLTISGTLTQNSDARLKTDVTALVGVSEKLAKLHGVSYSFADPTKHPEGRHIGLLAQEVRAVFPELVTEGPDGTLSVAYGNFAAVLLEAVKEQSAEVTALRKEHAVSLASRDAEIVSLREAQSALAERLARLEAPGAK